MSASTRLSQERPVLITGGSRGLGLQIAEGLGEMGARVALTARKADELAQARGELEAIEQWVHAR